MAGRVAGKVAFITGAARGQGRSHAIRLAEEGADIIAVDLLRDSARVPYAMATEADLAETVKQVEALDRRIVASQADVRDYGALKAAVDDGVAELGRLDIVVANAGICTRRQAWTSSTEADWQDMIDINLTGVWHTMQGGDPAPDRAAGGGSIIVTSSTAGLEGLPVRRAVRRRPSTASSADAETLAHGAGAGHDPGQQRAPDQREHRHDPERGHL